MALCSILQTLISPANTRFNPFGYYCDIPSTPGNIFFFWSARAHESRNCFSHSTPGNNWLIFHPGYCSKISNSCNAYDRRVPQDTPRRRYTNRPIAFRWSCITLNRPTARPFLFGLTKMHLCSMRVIV